MIILSQFVLWPLAIVGAATLAFGAMIAAPVREPPVLASIQAGAMAIGQEGKPELTRFQARDGTWLAYRFYPAASGAHDRLAILVHGSSASSDEMHGLAVALAAANVAAVAVDMRGHGASGARGDIAYLGQLDDDLADLLAQLRASYPQARLALIGHSSGGGFALRIAAEPLGGAFDKIVLLAPYLGYDAPTNRPNSGDWASPDIPRILALAALRRIGIDWCEALPVLAFAVPPNMQDVLVSDYSYRLMRNFATRGYKDDFASTTGPVSLIAGADDELMLPGKYADAVHAVAPKVDVKLIAGVNHMSLLSDPKAVSVIAEDVAKRGMTGT